MKIKSMLIAGTLALAVPSFAAAADLSGTWKLDTKIQDAPSEIDCTFTQSGDALSGTCNRAGDPASPATGTVADKTAKWSYSIDFGGQKIAVDYTADITSDAAMKGQWMVAGQGATDFTAAKQ
jgi:hypothetical protein